MKKSRSDFKKDTAYKFNDSRSINLFPGVPNYNIVSCYNRARTVIKHPCYDLIGDREPDSIKLDWFKQQNTFIETENRLQRKRTFAEKTKKKLQESWKELEGKELKLKEYFKSYSEFIELNKEKQIRAVNKIEESKRFTIVNEKRIKALKKKIELVNSARERIIKNIQKYYIYENYLRKVCVKNHELHCNADVVFNQFYTLTNTKNRVLLRQQELDQTYRIIRTTNDEMVTKKTSEILECIHMISLMRTKHDTVTIDSNKWQTILAEIWGRHRDFLTNLLTCKDAIRECYERIVSRKRRLHYCDSLNDIVPIEQKLDHIKQTILAFSKMTRKLRGKFVVNTIWNQDKKIETEQAKSVEKMDRSSRGTVGFAEKERPGVIKTPMFDKLLMSLKDAGTLTFEGVQLLPLTSLSKKNVPSQNISEFETNYRNALYNIQKEKQHRIVFDRAMRMFKHHLRSDKTDKSKSKKPHEKDRDTFETYAEMDESVLKITMTDPELFKQSQGLLDSQSDFSTYDASTTNVFSTSELRLNVEKESERLTGATDDGKDDSLSSQETMMYHEFLPGSESEMFLPKLIFRPKSDIKSSRKLRTNLDLRFSKMFEKPAQPAHLAHHPKDTRKRHMTRLPPIHHQERKFLTPKLSKHKLYD